MRPRVAMTMGDANGIGPEILVKVLADEELWAGCDPLLIGDVAVFEQIAGVVGIELRFRAITEVAQARFTPGVADVLVPSDLSVPDVRWGVMDPAMGEAVAVCMRAALQLGMDGKVDGFAGAPLNKLAFHEAGYDYLDELAYFSEVTGSTEAFFMGVIGDVLTTAIAEHVPFSAIQGRVTKQNILWTTRNMWRVLNQVGVADPTVAVAALNPHAGEGGLLGTDEIETIIPAIEAAQAEGINVVGPVPADVIFPQALRGDFDGIVGMYHDQVNTGRKLQPPATSATLVHGPARRGGHHGARHGF